MPRYDPRDRFFEMAKKEGLRARSAYKLDEIQRRLRILRPGARVLDLGAAPGGWYQIAARQVGERGSVIGVDLELIAPLPVISPITTGSINGYAAKPLSSETATRNNRWPSNEL